MTEAIFELSSPLCYNKRAAKAGLYMEAENLARKRPFKMALMEFSVLLSPQRCPPGIAIQYIYEACAPALWSHAT